MIPTTVPASRFEYATGRLDAVRGRRPPPTGRRHRAGRSHGLHGADLRTRLRAASSTCPGTGWSTATPRTSPARQLAAYMVAGPITDHETSDPGSPARAPAAGHVDAHPRGFRRPGSGPGPALSRRVTAPSERRCAPTTATRRPWPSTTTWTEWWRPSAAPACRWRPPCAPPRINPATLYRLFDRGSRHPRISRRPPPRGGPRCAAPARRHHRPGPWSRTTASSPCLFRRPPPWPRLRSGSSCPMRATLPPSAADGPHRARAIHLTPRAIVSDERFVEVAGCRRPSAGGPRATISAWRLSSSAGPATGAAPAYAVSGTPRPPRSAAAW